MAGRERCIARPVRIGHNNRMAKKKTFKRSVELPIQTVHEVVTDEDYILSMEQQNEGATAELVHSDIQHGEDGSLVADVEVRFVPKPASNAEGGESAKEQKPMQISQHLEVGALQGNAFPVKNVVPLPAGIGEMTTSLQYEADPADASVTNVDVVVEAKVSVPMLGGMIAKKLLADSENSVERVLERIVSTAEEKGLK